MHPKNSESERLQLRLSSVGGAIAETLEELPDTKIGRHVHDQLLRASSAPGVHYAEARGAQSRDDFVYRLGLSAKELREARHWLRYAHRAGLLEEEPSGIDSEISELVAILTSSLQTARRDTD